MTLLELMITVGLFSILALGTAASMTNVTRQALRVTNKRDQDMTWYLTQKQLSAAVVNVRAVMFRASRTYAPALFPTVTNQHTRVVPHQTTAFSTTGAVINVPLADINQLDTITTLPAANLSAESSFLDAMVNPLITAAGVPIYQDSFTLRRDEISMRPNGSMMSSLRTIYASRCLPIATTPLHSSGSTIDPRAPYKSAAYVFSALTRVPFVNSRVISPGRVQTWISCCPVGTPCVGNNLAQHFLRTYIATFNEAGRLLTVQETPSIGEANTIWGMGFMARFNSATAPTRYDLIMFSLRDLCKVIQVDRCMTLNPLMVKEKMTAYEAYFARHFPLRPLVLSGSVTPDLSNSGVLRLTQ